VTISAPLNKQVSIDFGYLNQLGIVRSGPDSMDYAMTEAVFANF
jgi:hypothetical protein